MRYALTAAGCSLAWLFPNLVQTWQTPVFLLVVATVGMAHGSLDHQVHMSEPGAKNSLIRFYGAYLLAAALVALVWWLAPLAGLLVFLGSSAYHFGQAEIPGSGSRGKGWLRTARLCWGTALLSVPVLAHPAELQASLMEWGLPVRAEAMQTAAWVVLGACLLGLLVALGGLGNLRSLRSPNGLNGLPAYALGQALNLRPLSSLLAYGLLLVSTPPLWGFCLYFGIWHAWPALRAIARELNLSHLGDWARALLPNYLPSLLASGLWIATAGMRPESYTIAGLLILLSALTVPHTWVFERLYTRA
jgi:beta-carotene 15,15'-dioxygenase